MYGTQTPQNKEEKDMTFENDVEMYGTQTSSIVPLQPHGLRMM